MASYGPFAYRLEEDDVAKAAAAFMRKRLFLPPSRWLLIAIAAISALLILFDLLDGMINLGSIAAIGAVPLAIWLAIKGIAPRMARRQYRQSAALRDEHSLSFDSDTITFAGTRGTVSFPLVELHAFTDMPDLLMIHQTEGFYNPIPKQALGEDAVKALADALRAAGVTQW
jgi:hypothetical protein